MTPDIHFSSFQVPVIHEHGPKDTQKCKYILRIY